MKKWRNIVRILAQMAVVGIILKALRGPVRWHEGADQMPAEGHGGKTS